MTLTKLSAAMACAVIISSCGGGGSGGEAASDSSGSAITSTGAFLDSAVQGMAYSTPTQSGVTNAAGGFRYLEGEQVTFKVGSIPLPPVTAQITVTPLDIFNATEVTNVRVSNLARLLQSLDADDNTANGISFADELQSASTGTVLDFADPDFANDAAVINLVANSGSTNTTLIDRRAAEAHLQDTLDTLEEKEPGDIQFDTTINLGGVSYVVSAASYYEYVNDGEHTYDNIPYVEMDFTFTDGRLSSDGEAISGTASIVLNIVCEELGTTSFKYNHKYQIGGLCDANVTVAPEGMKLTESDFDSEDDEVLATNGVFDVKGSKSAPRFIFDISLSNGNSVTGNYDGPISAEEDL